MLENTHDLPKATEWLLRKVNWMSGTIQNAILQLFVHAIQRNIVSEASECDFYGLTADGTTDINTNKQFPCNLQFVDKNMKQ